MTTAGGDEHVEEHAQGSRRTEWGEGGGSERARARGRHESSQLEGDGDGAEMAKARLCAWRIGGALLGSGEC